MFKISLKTPLKTINDMVELFESLKENIFKGLTLAKFAGFCFNGFEEC